MRRSPTRWLHSGRPYHLSRELGAAATSAIEYELGEPGDAPRNLAGADQKHRRRKLRDAMATYGRTEDLINLAPTGRSKS